MPSVNVITLKRSAVKGKVPTVSNLTSGELAINTRDGRLYSANTTQVFEIGSNPHNLTVGSGGFSIANGNITFPSADGTSNQILKTDGAGTLSFQDAGSIGTTNLTLSGNTAFSGNNTFQGAVVFNEEVTSTQQFNFEGPVTFKGDAVYQGSSRHTANVSIRASLAVQQYEFTSNTGQTLFKGTSDSQGLLSYTPGNISVYKDGIKLRPTIDFAETDSSSITLQDGTSNNNIITIEQYGSNHFQHYTYVANTGQTTFTGADSTGKTLSYTAQNPLGGGVKVYLNGVRLRANTDVVATNGTDVVLQDGTSNNDVIMIESLGPYPYQSFEYTGIHGQTTFNGIDRFGKQLEYEIDKATVYLNGVKLKEGTDWTAINGERVVLQEPVANNDVVTIDSHGPEPAIFSAQNEIHYANTTVLKTKEILLFDDLSSTVVDQFPTTDFISAQYLIQATNPNGVSFATYNVAHDRGQSFLSEFGRINSNGSIMTVTSDVSENLLRIKVAPQTTNTKLKIQATRMRKAR
tara:strand:- start:344 stop:1900 length:1557 start_codon:yes stop_codon:yes gene_type:complete